MKETLQGTWKYYKNILGILIVCTIMGLMQMVMLLVEPQIISLIVDRVINPAVGNAPVENSSVFFFLIRDIPEHDVWRIMGVLVVTFLIFLALYFVLFYLRWNIAHYYSSQCEKNMRRDLLNKINSFGVGLLKDYSTGDLITIINRDTSNIRNAYIAGVPFMCDSLFYIVVAVYFLSRLDVTLIIFPLLTLVVFALITKGLIKTFGKMYEMMWKKNSDLNTETQESIYGFRTIKAYAREEFQQKKFSNKAEDLKDFHTGFGKTRYRYFLMYDTVDNIVMVVSMGISIYLASKMKMSSGEYSAFLSYLLMICGCFINLIFLASDIQDYVVSGKRLHGLFEKKDETAEKFGTRKVDEKPNIEVKNVSSKVDGKTLLDDISVQIPYGKKIGVMGKTGSGKSVFLKTLQTFMEYEEGEITIDNRPLEEYDRREIARTYSYAMQDVFLFSNTIESNIAYYNPYADEKIVEKCGKLAEVDEFAMTFPDGYQTVVGEKGFGLSGGQKQRVAIARALLKDAPVIVLDDCTSALDVETESKIFKNLKEHCTDKTLIIATHRAPAIKDCDEILFFEDGKIVERGTFEQLIQLNGRYASIYNRQVESGVIISE
ncbi:ABC transporter ATP-binding protein [Anaerosporobacter sp.]|uniref:ABC transporter ATP-binding protein n=1 Tax=Anaerosporobacter sp. TaxID=1872529 RepID=UPI00286F4DFB|nr:ABC transporter ATP-binding protein [Anaerosporobacter sp.]